MAWRQCLSERLQKTNGWDILSKRSLQRSSATGIRDLYGGSLFWFFLFTLVQKESVTSHNAVSPHCDRKHPSESRLCKRSGCIAASYHERNPSHSSRLIQMWDRNSVEISIPYSPTCKPPVIRRFLIFRPQSVFGCIA